ncbi:cytochrome b/b6 domain-containing protein [Pseudomonadales bacterium]|nr:cytochrome b/b6 domain-containing protein [Pseudomonadales bacterium]
MSQTPSSKEVSSTEEASSLKEESRPGATGMLVWDLPLRLFHWALALSLVGSWATAEAGFDWTETHFLFGYTALGLISFRLLWGLFGTAHARFYNFLTGPKAVISALGQLKQQTPPGEISHVGHGPLGGWASVVLLALVMTQAVSGLFISDDIFYAGPYNSAVSSSLVDYLGWLHHTNFNILLAAVALHLVTITWYLLGKRENLIKPMLTGKKNISPSLAKHKTQPEPQPLTQPAVPSNLLWRGFFIAIFVLVMIVLLVNLAPEPEYF